MGKAGKQDYLECKEFKVISESKGKSVKAKVMLKRKPKI